jgi:hypothetical protein
VALGIEACARTGHPAGWVGSRLVELVSARGRRDVCSSAGELHVAQSYDDQVLSPSVRLSATTCAATGAARTFSFVASARGAHSVSQGFAAVLSSPSAYVGCLSNSTAFGAPTVVPSPSVGYQESGRRSTYPSRSLW